MCDLGIFPFCLFFDFWVIRGVESPNLWQDVVL